MEINVNATRMELLKLGRRTQLARRGHKLLKDKLDGLVQDFIKTSKNLRKSYDQLRGNLVETLAQSTIEGAGIDYLSYRAALLSPTLLVNLEEKSHNLMGVKIPRYEIRVDGKVKSFGDIFFTDEFIKSIDKLKDLLPEMIRIAELYKALHKIGREIIEIKRRVNALEYVLIPELEGKIRYIKMKLAEMERGTIVTLLKIKELVQKQR